MAISDTLYDAAEQIRVYMRERAEAYAPMKAQIDALLKDMDAIRIELDTPPNRTPRNP